MQLLIFLIFLILLILLILLIPLIPLILPPANTMPQSHRVIESQSHRAMESWSHGVMEPQRHAAMDGGKRTTRETRQCKSGMLIGSMAISAGHSIEQQRAIGSAQWPKNNTGHSILALVVYNTRHLPLAPPTLALLRERRKEQRAMEAKNEGC